MAYKDRKSRKLFEDTWKDRGYEKGETQQFWLSLLTNVLGYEHNDTVLFEHHTTTGGFIDVWIRQVILDARAQFPDKSLAILYDPDKMPTDLKVAHEANDKAVMDAYGFAHDMSEPEIVAEFMKMYQRLVSGD
ncbi:MAG: hypothetical protein K5665_00750 [Saccharofermentans sp.]|nr:hypothetical protein [Saccharofermentans sp.]